jgi:hypothetical protein
VTKNLNIQVKKKNVADQPKREKRGLREELLKMKAGVEHVSSLIPGRTGG